jgi:hypothetical protein
MNPNVCGRCEINRRTSLKLNLITGILLVIVLLAAGCGGNDGSGKPTATRRPPTITPTPTPRSTALPLGPETPPLGSRDRPIDVLIALPGLTSDNDAEGVAADLQRYLRNQLSERLVSEIGIPVDNAIVNVTFATSAQAFQAVCGRPESGNATIVWIDAFTYAEIQSQCDVTPMLALTHENNRRDYVGRSVDIVSRVDINALSDLANQTFCRINAQDFTSWVLPSIILASEGIEAQLDLQPAQDYDDSAAMVQAIYKGECAAAAIPPGEFNDILDEVITSLDQAGESVTREQLEAAIKILSPAGSTTAPTNFDSWQGYEAHVIPYEVLVFPSNIVIPSATRNLMTEIIYDFFSNTENGGTRLQDLMSASGIFHVQPSQFQAFDTLLTQANWDMAAAD